MRRGMSRGERRRTNGVKRSQRSAVRPTRRRRLPIALALVTLLAGACAGALLLSAPAPAFADGTISGTVGAPDLELANMLVTAYSSTHSQNVYGGIVGVGGAYTITGVPADTYKVQFMTTDGSLGFQYYSDKATVKSADLVTVTDGATTSGIDATMHPAGTISGTVSDASGPLGEVECYVYDVDGAYVANQTTYGTDGTYAVTGLAGGTYEVRFVASGYDVQWYDGKDETTADPVAVSAGAVTNHIDALLVPTGASLPVVDSVTSTTHPDPAKWYSNADPLFSWQTTDYGKTILGFSCGLDGSPTTDPPESLSTPIASASYPGTADGIWYFHVRADTAAGWGATTHRTVRIDTHRPTAKVSSLTVKRSAAAKIVFRLSDPLPSCGRGSVKLVIRNARGKTVKSCANAKLATNTKAIWKFVCKLAKGRYTISVTGADAAGNHTARAAKATLKVK
jgi:Carboxypeptidase regulatory-like domain